MWGDDDAVSPMKIPESLAEIIDKQHLTVKTVKNTGGTHYNQIDINIS